MPNQLVIVMDDMKTDLLSHLPYSSAIAREGTSFLHRLNTPLCQVWRTTFFTGQYSKDHTVFGNTAAELDGAGFTTGGGGLFDLTIQNALANSGVWCGFLGKEFNFGSPANDAESGQHTVGDGWEYWRSFCNTLGSFYGVPQQLSFGYEVWDGTTTIFPELHYLDYLYLRLQDAIAAATEPWFIEVCVTGPHVPLNPRPVDNHGWETYHYDMVEETHLNLRPSWVQGKTPIESDDLYKLRDYIRRSLREAMSVDRFINDAVTLVGLDDTDVFLTNDNSIHAGECRYKLDDKIGLVTKNSPYDASMKAHLICAGPSFPSDGRFVNAPTSNIDIPATLLAAHSGASALHAANIPNQYGVDLRDVAVDPDAYAARQLLHQMRGNGFPDVDVISTRDWKLARYFGTYPVNVKSLDGEDPNVHDAGDPVDADDEYELYDLVNDPYELHNRAADGGSPYPATKAILDAQLDLLL